MSTIPFTIPPSTYNTSNITSSSFHFRTMLYGKTFLAEKAMDSFFTSEDVEEVSTEELMMYLEHSVCHCMGFEFLSYLFKQLIICHVFSTTLQLIAIVVDALLSLITSITLTESNASYDVH